MRLISYRSQRGERAGISTEAGVIDVADALGRERVSVRELLASSALAELEAIDGEPVAGEIELLPPIPDPDKIVCFGLNYHAHAAEAGVEPPQAPTFFAKFRNALVGHGAAVSLPAASDKVDYEAEVAFVIGRRCHRVPEAKALDVIAGYTLLNDLSARDLQFATPQWIPGKVFDGAGPCGPALVTPDEAGPHDGISIALDLNGERMQEATTADLIFSIPRLLSHLSQLMTLEPGDIVSTGTPAGVGSVREPRVWLKPGDEIAITSPTLGRLETRIA